MQRDLLIMKRIHSSSNCSDTSTKHNGQQLFYYHFDYIMGQIISSSVKVTNTHQSQIFMLMDQQNYTVMNKLNLIDYSILNSGVLTEYGGDIMTKSNRGYSVI